MLLRGFRSLQLQRFRLRQPHCDSPWRAEYARPYATTSSTVDETPNTYGSITTKTPQTTPIEELLAGLKSAIRSDDSSSRAAGSSLLGLFLTPTYAHHALDPELPLRAWEHLNGNRRSVRDLKSIVAVVDRIPGNVIAGTRLMRGAEGLAYTFNQCLNSGDEETLSDRSLQDSSIRSSKQLSQPKPGTLSFHLRAQPDLGCYDAEISMPLAQTTFSTGRISTMVSASYKPDPTQGNILTTPETIVSLESQRVPLVFEAASAGVCTANMVIPLKPLTQLRRVEHCMGNIIRSLSSEPYSASRTLDELRSSQENPQESQPQPASSELESAIQSFFAANEIPPQPVQIWALILPADVARLDPRVRDFLVTSQVLQRLILHHGARLCRVLSGGGGWGKKAGLLSLDPENGYGGQSRDESERNNDPISFTSIEDVEKSKDSALGDIVKEGEHVMFLLGPPSSHEFASGRQTGPVNFQSTESDDPRRQSRGILFGCLPSSIDDVPQPEADSNDTASSHLDNIVHQRNYFGVFSEGGLAFTCTPVKETTTISRANQTKIDVPFARIGYQRAPNILNRNTTEEEIQDEYGSPESSSRIGEDGAQNSNTFRLIKTSGGSGFQGDKFTVEYQTMSQQLVEENNGKIDLEDFVQRNTKTLDPKDFAKRLPEDR